MKSSNQVNPAKTTPLQLVALTQEQRGLIYAVLRERSAELKEEILQEEEGSHRHSSAGTELALADETMADMLRK
jgi:hypothetical protein